jgi:hypothetical protein
MHLFFAVLVASVIGAPVGLPPVAATGPEPEPSAVPSRVMVVGDSIALSLIPNLEQAGAALGVELLSAALNGCGVIVGQPTHPDGTPYIDVVQDTRLCVGTAMAAQNAILTSQPPDVIVWMSGWESWPDRVVDGQLVRFNTLTGNNVILAKIDEAVRRLTAGGARLVFVPVAPKAYPSQVGFPNIPGDFRVTQLNKMLRNYASDHPDLVSFVDLPALICPTGAPCPAEPVPGIRPRDRDGFHFIDPGAQWVADQLMPVILEPPPPPPPVPTCTRATVGQGAATAPECD